MRTAKNLFAASLIFVACAMLGGCASAKRQSDIALNRSGQDARFGTKPTNDGFEIEIEYSRYQFVPESDAVAAACKSQLLALAYQHADETGRRLEPINEQRIRISMGRNGLAGMTTCRAHGVATWKQ